MRAVRLWIKKEGRAKYISHLDMNRCFTRAVRRAKLNLWYTEGFNPHPYLCFLTPLSLGQESDGEPLDIRIEDDMTDSEIMKRMNDVLPEGISVVRVHEALSKASEIAYASYILRLEFPSEESAKAFAEQAKSLVDGGELYAEKLGKQGRKKVTKQVSVCEKMHSFSVQCSGDTVQMNVVLNVGNDMLNPTLLIDALQKATDTAPFVSIRRTGFFKADMQAFA